IRNITITSIGLRPALLFFSFAGVNTADSISARELSTGTTRAIISNGSPFAEITANRLSASKNPNCPIVSHPRIFVAPSQTPMNSQTLLFFEVPINVYLEQRRRMIAGPPSFQRTKATKAKLAKVKTINESVNCANQIVLRHIVFKFGWEQTALAPINPFHEARHPSLPLADSPAES